MNARMPPLAAHVGQPSRLAGRIAWRR